MRRDQDLADGGPAGDRPAAARGRRRRSPRRRPCRCCRASASAASSIRPPRAQLMIRTDGFISAISRGADQVAGLGRQRRVQRDEVAAAPEVVEPRDALDAAFERLLGGQERVEADDRHAEPLRPLGDRQPDPAQADDAQRLAVELGAGELVPVPLARLEAVVGLGHVPRQRQAARPSCARPSRSCCRPACSSRRSRAGSRPRRRCCRRPRPRARSP